MKKICTTLILMISVLLSFSAFTPAFATDEITVVLDGETLSFEQAPVIVNERTLVPMRAIFEALNAKVNWYAEERIASAEKMGIMIDFQIDNYEMYKNFVTISLDAPAMLINGYTMVPLRAVAESFGVEVIWDGTTKTATLTDKGILQRLDIPERGILYEGEVKDGIPYGYGTFVMQEEDAENVMIGLFDNDNIIQGVLTKTDVSGETIMTEMKDNVPFGDFEVRYKDGSYIKGRIENNLIQGIVEIYNAGTNMKSYTNYKDGQVVAMPEANAA